MFSCIFYISDQNKSQEICDIIISEHPFSMSYFPDKYRFQQMCDEAVDNCLAALKFVLDLFVASKMIKILFTSFYPNGNIFYFNEDSGSVVFTCNGMGIFNIDLNNINFDDTSYDEHDPDTKKS